MKKTIIAVAAVFICKLATADEHRYALLFHDAANHDHRVEVMTSMGREAEVHFQNATTQTEPASANAAVEFSPARAAADRVLLRVEPMEIDNEGRVATNIHYFLGGSQESVEGSAIVKMTPGETVELTGFGSQKLHLALAK